MPPIKKGRNSEGVRATAPLRRLTTTRKHKILNFQQMIRRNPLDLSGKLIEIGSQIWKQKLLEFLNEDVEMSDLDRWINSSQHKWIREMANAVVSNSPRSSDFNAQENAEPIPQDQGRMGLKDSGEISIQNTCFPGTSGTLMAPKDLLIQIGPGDSENGNIINFTGNSLEQIMPGGITFGTVERYSIPNCYVAPYWYVSPGSPQGFPYSGLDLTDRQEVDAIDPLQ